VQPRYTLFASLAYIRPGKFSGDRDNDNITGKKDKCPDQPEDIDGFEDEDGCPDLDNDADGIPDLKDRCPLIAEDNDGFEDSDGCPDLDNDNDGVPDTTDKCPDQPEDIDEYEDEDGCPDLDNDADGIPDLKDRCPAEAEDRDGYEDSDGCMDLDNDADGIPDSLDKCPNEKETVNNYHDQDGCSDVKPKEIRIGRTIMGGVRFIPGTSMWTPESENELANLVRSLKAFPKVLIEIHGHTDSFGSRLANKTLSEKMAKSVMDYMVDKDVPADRMSIKGFGEEKPIAPNNTAEGRNRNRRIEIYRTE
jgi:outer membrane protein OmpA-like peptidoglycan-associated protein